MWTLIVAGGFPRWFLLIFGLLTWVAAAVLTVAALLVTWGWFRET